MMDVLRLATICCLLTQARGENDDKAGFKITYDDEHHQPDGYERQRLMDEFDADLRGEGGEDGQEDEYYGEKIKIKDLKKQYWVFVDCNGDTSRMHAFEYIESGHEIIDDRRLKNLTHELLGEVQGGIHESVNDPNKAAEDLKKLFGIAQKRFTRKQSRDIKVTIFATGPLRWLSGKKKEKVEKTLRQGLLDSHEFTFEEKNLRLEVLPGHLEHSYDSAAANFLLKRLNSHLRPTAAGVRFGVVGTLDADGESSWISIPKQAVQQKSIGDAHIFDVYKYRHFGFTAARNSTDRFVVNSNNFTSMPCYFPGYEVPDTGLKGSGDFDECVKVIIGHVLDERKKCREWLKETKRKAQQKLGYYEQEDADIMAGAPPEGTPDYQKWIEEKTSGAFAYSDGDMMIAMLEDQALQDHHRDVEHRATECAPGIDARSRKALHPDPVVTHDQKQINGHQYYAGSEYLRVVNFISYWREKKGDGTLKGEMPTPSLKTLTASVQELCKTSWDDIAKGDQPAGFNKSQAAGMCFEATYMLAKLVKFYGYKHTTTSPPYVTFVDSIAGQKIDWPLGAFLHLREHDQAREAKEQHELIHAERDKEMRKNEERRKQAYQFEQEQKEYNAAMMSGRRKQEEL